MLCSFACPILAVPKLTPQTPQVEWLNKRSAPAAQMFHAPAAEQLPKALAKEQFPVAPAAEQLPQPNLGQKGPRHVPASSAMAWLNSDAFGPRLDLEATASSDGPFSTSQRRSRNEPKEQKDHQQAAEMCEVAEVAGRLQQLQHLRALQEQSMSQYVKYTQALAALQDQLRQGDEVPVVTLTVKGLPSYYNEEMGWIGPRCMANVENDEQNHRILG